ncbi:MAG TPA: hypothetical protein VGG09_07475 [Acidimicrobiales bacterium]|jgi:hypothetical protein
MTMAMVADGVELGDQDAMNAWIKGFNSRSFEERGRVLGLSDDEPSAASGRGGRGGKSAPALRLRPVVLAPEEELVEAARGAVLFQRIEKLVSFVGDGRKLTDRGNLKLADGKALVELLGTDDEFDKQFGDQVFRTRSSADLPGVHRTFRLALASGFLERPDVRSVRPGPEVALLDDAPLEALLVLFEMLTEVVGTTRLHDEPDRYGFGWYAEELDHQLPGMLSLLYSSPVPVEIDDIADLLWARLNDRYDLDRLDAHRLEMEEEFVNHDLRRAFDRLGELGLVVKSGVVLRETSRYSTEEVGGTVTLTPLGTWTMHRLLSGTAEVPVGGALASVSADELLRRVADLPDDVGALEVETWMAGHGDEAAALLVGALGAADETGRVVGFQALSLLGPSASKEVARLERDPELSAYATVWQVDAGLCGLDELDAAGDPKRFVRLLYAVLTLWGPDAVAKWLVPVSGAGGVDAGLAAAWQVRLPETETVLSVIGDIYPDKAVAKVARKALFRHRSSGGAAGAT